LVGETREREQDIAAGIADTFQPGEWERLCQADQRLVIRTMARADLKAEKLDKMLVALDLHFRAP
jgi:hypothetical protein